MTLPEPASDAKGNPNDRSGVQQSSSSITSVRDKLILDALRRGEPYREIAKTYSASLTTVVAIARQLDSFDKEGVAKFMALNALEMLDTWKDAAINGAKAGKHAPAKDWLLHAKVLDPVQSDSGSGAKVAVIIGAPGQPVTLPNVQVIASQSVTDSTDE